MHKRSVGGAVRFYHIPQTGGTCYSYIITATNFTNHPVVAAVGINVELRCSMAALATGTTCCANAIGIEHRRLQKQLLALIFQRREIGKRLRIIGHLTSAGIVFGIEGLNATNEMRQCFLNAYLRYSGIAIHKLEQLLIIR